MVEFQLDRLDLALFVHKGCFIPEERPHSRYVRFPRRLRALAALVLKGNEKGYEGLDVGAPELRAPSCKLMPLTFVPHETKDYGLSHNGTIQGSWNRIEICELVRHIKAPDDASPKLIHNNERLEATNYEQADPYTL